MYLLKRIIAPYSGYDQLLSIAKSLETAKDLRRRYIEKRLENDPWREQGYHDVNLEEDTIVEDISSFFNKMESKGTTFFLVCHLEDYLGLCSLKIQKIFDTRQIAEKYLKDFEEYCDLQGEEEYLEVFEPEKITEKYLKDLRTRLDLDKDDEYFEQWGGELKIYEIQKNVLRKEDIPFYQTHLKKAPVKIKESLLEKIIKYFKKKEN
jgi:hypothetical protein